MMQDANDLDDQAFKLTMITSPHPSLLQLGKSPEHR
jgi:hypothetical protein